jgi:hypothetical protein
MAVVHQLPEEGELVVANKGGELRGCGRFISSPWSGRWAAARAEGSSDAWSAWLREEDGAYRPAGAGGPVGH